MLRSLFWSRCLPWEYQDRRMHKAHQEVTDRTALVLTHWLCNRLSSCQRSLTANDQSFRLSRHSKSPNQRMQRGYIGESVVFYAMQCYLHNPTIPPSALPTSHPSSAMQSRTPIVSSPPKPFISQPRTYPAQHFISHPPPHDHLPFPPPTPPPALCPAPLLPSLNL